MAIFASDTESGTAGTLLENHAMGVGGPWVKGGGRAGSMALTPSNTSRLTAGEGAYFATGVAASSSADYDVEEDFVFATASGYRALVLRGNISGALGYMVGVDNGGTWVIYKDTAAQVSVAVGAVSAGGIKHVKGSIRGNTITMSVDGTQILTWADTANSYTAPGQAGIYCYGVGTDTTGLQGKNFVATDLSPSGGATTFTLSQITALGGAGASPLYALTKTTGGNTFCYGQSDGLELMVTGTRAVFAVQSPTTWAVSIDGGAYAAGVDDGTGKLLAFTGLSDVAHLVKIKTASSTSGIAATGTLAVSGAGPTIATPSSYGPWRTIGSYQYPAPATYVSSGGFDASDTWVSTAASSTFAFLSNDKFSQPTVRFKAQASSVWVWCGAGDVPRCKVDGLPLAAVPYAAPATVAGFSPAGWVRVADLDEPQGNAAATGITAACQHTFEITLGNYTSTQNGSPIFRVMLGGVGAAFSSSKPADDYGVYMGDSILQGQSYGGANYDATQGSFAYHASGGLGVLPYVNGLAGTRIADLQSRFAASIAPLGTSLGRAPKFGLIYMGSNDVNTAGDSAFISSYQATIGAWFSAYPSAPLFCYGLKNGPGLTPSDMPVSQNIATAVANFQSANPSKASLVHYRNAGGVNGPNNFDGELHPSNIGSRIMGRFIAADAGSILTPAATATYTAAANVRSGVDRGDGTTGTLVVPAASTVLAGTTFDNGTAGTATVPTASQVLSGVAYGAGGNALTGNVTEPAATSVATGVQYGAGGTQFTGTMAAGITLSQLNNALATVPVTVADKTGFSLAATGLDAISTAAPANQSAPTFRQMVVMTYLRWFGRATGPSTSSGSIQVFSGNTAVSTQAYSDNGTTQTQGAAS